MGLKLEHDQRTDLTQYSENELSLMVFNDEGLYRMRNRSYLIETLRELFIFSDEQLDVLKQDIQDDNEEN